MQTGFQSGPIYDYEPSQHAKKPPFRWSSVPLRYPLERSQMMKLPGAGDKKALPRIQHRFGRESGAARETRLSRLALVKSNFTHAWAGYKKKAWLADELKPLSGGMHNPYGGWAATLVDSLDTLCIMGLKDEFDAAVVAIDAIDFSSNTLEELNVFETNIRYLGGFLAAYDCAASPHPRLLAKAVELGDMLYMAFDTPNHMPNTRWRWHEAREGKAPQFAPETMLLAEIGSLSLEFTRLSQLSGDPKYFDLVQRINQIFAAQQDHTLVQGLWPMIVDAKGTDFTQETTFTIGGMADSMYEYLAKQYVLLNGADATYKTMYAKAVSAMEKHIFYRPMTPDGTGDMLLPGHVVFIKDKPLADQATEPRAEHLGCFAGGMLALGSRALDRPGDMVTARRLVEGCLWAYEAAPGHIMPEILHTTKCPEASTPCAWDEKLWHNSIRQLHEGGGPDFKVDKVIAAERLTPGFVRWDDKKYHLRPEAIESVFVLYRLTGEAALMDRAWAMFETIAAATQTELAHASLEDCTVADIASTRVDRMESFWLAETLKYFKKPT